MPLWCRLCREPVVEGSLFCARHRAQAAFFSRTFGPEPGADGASATPAEEPTLPPAAARCATLVLEQFAELSKGADTPAARDRWPQISVYNLHGQLHARTYYSVVPAQAAASAQPHFGLQHPAIRAAMALTGCILKELLTHFESHAAELERCHVQTLDLHFLTYAGLVAINLHRTGQKDVNLLTLSVEERGLTPVTLDSVRSRLFHKRW